MDQPSADHFFSLAQNTIDYNKLYIGQLPLSITEPFIRDAISKFTQVKDVRIIKGDARGTFDRFCYAFVMVRGTPEICNDVIKKVNQANPDWKMNIKVDQDRLKYIQQHQNQQQPRQNYQPRMGYEQKDPSQQYYQPQQYQPQTPGMYPPQQQGYYQPQQQHHHQYQQSSSQPEKIVGEKHHRILVREIWLGGIPELCDKQYMHQLMSEFGIVENLEIFPKFAFIKFRMVQQAATAFQRAQRIYMMFGNPPGFRIFFSDPSRRANIVSNHYEYDRQSPFLPILFLGFPPVTSATIDLDLMRSIVEKFGNVVNSYMRKNSNNQTRSYFLFTFDNLKSALRAKAQLNKRRDLLGDKRAEVTLLLDEELVLRGRDLSHTQRMFQGDGNPNEKKKLGSTLPTTVSNDKPYTQKPYSQKPYTPTTPPQQYPLYPQTKQLPPQQLPPMPYGSMYHPPGMQYPGYMMPQTSHTYPPSDMYYMPPSMYYNKDPIQQQSSSTDVHELLQAVFQKKSVERELPVSNIEKKPVKTASNNDQNASDIVSKMLGQEKQEERDREVTWSGFLTWKGLHRVEVDGYAAEAKELEDYVINITHLIDFKDIVRKEKTVMIFNCGSSIHEPLFKEYLRALRGKAGVSTTSHYLIYIFAKSKESDEIQEIRDNELLAVMERPSLYSLIKDKLQKCEQLKEKA